MVRLVCHIDEIARSKKSDVLWIAFDFPQRGSFKKMAAPLRHQRVKIISWLKRKKIMFEECYGIFDGALEEPYRGNLYIDLPLEKNNQQLLELEALLEHSDGSPKMEGVCLYHLPVKVAQKNRRYYREVMSSI